jgi:hypothetical protein
MKIITKLILRPAARGQQEKKMALFREVIASARRTPTKGKSIGKPAGRGLQNLQGQSY